MLTVTQFKSLLDTTLQIVQQIVAAKHPLAGGMFSAAVTAFQLYEPAIIQALQQKGIIQNAGHSE